MKILSPLHPLRNQRLKQYIKHLPKLVAYYPLNETDGSTAYNKAPATLGTLNGSITSATIGQNGKVGKAYSFNGTSSVITLPNGVSAKNQSLVSIGAIVKVTDSAVTKSIIWEAVNSGTTTRLGIDLFTDEKLRLAARSTDSIGGQVITTSSALSAGYHFIGVTVDVPNKAGLIYVDGVSVSTTGSFSGFDGSVFTNSDPSQLVSVGRSASAEWFNDQIQHLFKVHGRLVTATEWLKLARIAGLA